MKKYMIVEPPGGLCNRMHVVRTAWNFSKKYNYKLIVFWNNNHELGCNFKDIFNRGDFIVWSLKWPRKTIGELWHDKKWINLCYAIPIIGFIKLFHKFLYKKECVLTARTPEESVEEYIEECDNKFLKRGNIIYYRQHYNYTKDINNYSMLSFKPEFVQMAEKLVDNDGKRIIGVHIRRTDHKYCMEITQLDVFIQKINAEILEWPDTKFFLATDDEQVLLKLKHLFPGKIIYNESCQRDRVSKNGIYSAVVDLIALSKTQKIIGSHGSTYSYLAAFMGKIVVEYYYPEKGEWLNFNKLYIL